jgi:CubicO group peptidase (beta-lactamase class C family)
MRSLLIAVLLPALLPAQDAAIRAAMQKMIDAQEIPGAVTAIATRNGVTHLAATGAVKKNSLFWIASMTKPVAGTAILMLQEEGKLSVDDPVAKHIPSFSKYPNITLKHLLTHSSGLAEATPAEWAAARKLGDLIPAYLAKPLQFAPGSQWKYCQSGINTLGHVVEVASGQPFEKFLAERLFRPLGMKDTTFFPTAKQKARLIRPVRKDKDTGKLGPATLPPGFDPEPFPAANGGLFSTAADYLRFQRMILNEGTLDGKRYLKPESVRQMTTLQSGDLKTGFTPGHGWGLAWCVVREPQGVTKWLSPGSFGHGGAYGTQAWIDPQRGVALLLLVQRAGFANSDDSPVRHAFQQAALSQ